ncbi:hypothetical protein [Agromyces sp. NPDC058104]|uniref:hypothetical protein n=1 Tax=Agromyces sp. NPDC058104 TaxID=3346342 RepID=UPI0036D8D912
MITTRTARDTRFSGSLRSSPHRTWQSRPATGITSFIVLALFAMVAACIPTGLLAVSLDAYWGYVAATPEHGDQATANADQELFGVGLSSFLLVLFWLLMTGFAASIAAATGAPVLRTSVIVGVGLALFMGIMLFLWLTIGTVPVGAW